MTRLAAHQVTVDIGKSRILKDVSAEFEAGQLTGLIGPNGAGKSTLIRALCNLLSPVSGDVRLNDRAIAGYRRKDLARQISYLPQGHVMHWPLEVERLVALGRLPHLGPMQSAGLEDQAVIERVMGRTEVLAFRRRTADTLSGGERARVMLARALASETEVLLVDEPVASLDPYHQLHVMELLKSLAQEGRLVVCVLHDLALAARFCDRLVLMGQGQVLAQGPRDNVLSEANLARAFSILPLRGEHEAQAYILPWSRLAARETSSDSEG
ncbi:MAG: ABC transporter ATP-binding protein [Pseudomonadota bacterium]